MYFCCSFFFFIENAAKTCEKAEGIINGYFEGDSHVFTSQVIYHCNEGFQMVGLTDWYCQSNGAWSAPPPSCERKFLLLAA